jgi:hypothetical protein
MKTKLATSLSVAAVLAAGSAAAIVNTEILDGGSREAAASAAVLPPASSVDVAVPNVTVGTLPVGATIVTVPSAPARTRTPPSTQAPAPAVASTSLTAFNVGDAGVVTVDVIDGQIVLVSAEPKPGWTVAKSEERADVNDVEVQFVSVTTRVEFKVALVDGQIVPTVESSSIASSAPLPTAETGDMQPTGTVGSSDDGPDDDFGDAEDDPDSEDHDSVEVRDDSSEREDD